MLVIKNELTIIGDSYIDINLYKTIFRLFKIIIQSDEFKILIVSEIRGIPIEVDKKGKKK